MKPKAIILLFISFLIQNSQADLLVIAHPDTPLQQINADQLADIFTAKMKSWPDGKRIIPVNREANSVTRGDFSQAVFNEPPEALADYWAKLQFKGEKPPLIQESDNGALLFVQRVPGAIAYVNKSIAVSGVKILITLPTK